MTATANIPATDSSGIETMSQATPTEMIHETTCTILQAALALAARVQAALTAQPTGESIQQLRHLMRIVQQANQILVPPKTEAGSGRGPGRPPKPCQVPNMDPATGKLRVLAEVPDSPASNIPLIQPDVASSATAASAECCKKPNFEIINSSCPIPVNAVVHGSEINSHHLGSRQPNSSQVCIAETLSPKDQTRQKTPEVCGPLTTI